MITKKSVLNGIVILVLLYFSFHLIYGNRGIIAYLKLQLDLTKSFNKLQELKSEKFKIENRARLLRPESLDKDILDEITRNILGLSSSKEQIFRPQRDEQP